jgi:hypothetical protein
MAFRRLVMPGCAYIMIGVEGMQRLPSVVERAGNNVNMTRNPARLRRENRSKPE